MLKGWIAIDRSLLKSPIFAHEGMFRLWMFCLMKANWKDGKWLVPGTLSERMIPRGSFITGRESLWEQMYPKRDEEGQAIKRDYTPTSRTVWRWMEALERMECVKLENVSNRCTHVTVINYSTYQDDNRVTCPTGVQPVSSTCPTGVQPVSTIEEYNNSTRKEDVISINEIPERFRTEDVLTALGSWKKHMEEPSDGNDRKPFTELERKSLLFEAASQGWDANKLARSLHGSISRGWRNLRDIDSLTGARPQKPAPQAPQETQYKNLDYLVEERRKAREKAN